MLSVDFLSPLFPQERLQVISLINLKNLPGFDNRMDKDLTKLIGTFTEEIPERKFEKEYQVVCPYLNIYRAASSCGYQDRTGENPTRIDCLICTIANHNVV